MLLRLVASATIAAVLGQQHANPRDPNRRGGGGQVVITPVPAPGPPTSTNPVPSSQTTAPASHVTAAQIKSLKTAIAAAFKLSPSYGTQCILCAEGAAVGGLLRMAFHDAAGAGTLCGISLTLFIRQL